MAKTLEEHLIDVLSGAIECDRRRCPIARCHCADQARAVADKFVLVKSRKIASYEWPPEDRKRLLAMHADPKMTYRAMAEEFGVTMGSIRGQLRAMNAPPRRAWGPGRKLNLKDAGQ